METIEQAKADLRQGWKTPNGAICPCCGQLVKLYRRNIYSTIARELISLYHLNRNNDEFHHRETFALRKVGGGDFAKLRYWGLIEEKPNDDNEKRSSGYWRITLKGELYVENVTRHAKYALVYNDQAIDFEGPLCGITDALGDKFNYRELMGYLL